MQTERAFGLQRRLIIDLSSTARWTGPPVGIFRAEREIAGWMLENVPGAASVFFDPIKKVFRTFLPEWTGKMLQGRAIIDAWGMPNPSPFYRSRRDRIPSSIKPWADWVLQSRRSLLRAIERRRLTTRSERAKDIIDRLQKAAMSAKYRRVMLLANGARRDLVPADLMLGDELEFNANDVVLCAGFPWAHLDMQRLRALKGRRGFSLVLLCYDIIPLLYPEMYQSHDVTAFRQYYNEAFPAADLVIFNSRCVANDAHAYCDRNGLPIKKTAVCPLGADAVHLTGNRHRQLPDGLEDGRYILFVSTIEPRKGHDLLYRVWLRLLARNIPQTHRFKLVFVGRPGWMVDELLEALKTDARLAGTVRLLSELDDEALAALYKGAAFCVYPSLYEGYGLPVVEALQFGKAVIASNGGALPELVNGFSPCLDPRNEDLWHVTLSRWIEDSGSRAPFEQDIRARFRHPTWGAASELIYQAIEELQRPAHQAAADLHS